MKRLGDEIDVIVKPDAPPRVIVLKTDFPEPNAMKGTAFSRIDGSPLWTSPGKQIGILATRVRKGLKGGEFEEVQ
jgi:hypothetical protein